MIGNKPVIGITLDSAEDGEKHRFAPKPWYALRKGYSEIVSKTGGVPVLLPYSEDIDSILKLIDGLIIPGGDADIHPRFYGQEFKTDRTNTNDARAEFELRILEKALHKGLPILGICNGLQIMNVFCGGTLYQHLPDYINSEINHEQPAPKDIPSHDIILEEGTILRSLSKERIVAVNSTHHQAIDRLGKGLTVSARAPDGVIEAIEMDKREFVVGVEWHPEHLNSELDCNLFRKLVEASKSLIHSSG